MRYKLRCSGRWLREIFTQTCLLTDFAKWVKFSNLPSSNPRMKCSELGQGELQEEGIQANGITKAVPSNTRIFLFYQFDHFLLPQLFLDPPHLPTHTIIYSFFPQSPPPRFFLLANYYLALDLSRCVVDTSSDTLLENTGFPFASRLTLQTAS